MFTLEFNNIQATAEAILNNDRILQLRKQYYLIPEPELRNTLLKLGPKREDPSVALQIQVAKEIIRERHSGK